MSPTQQNENTSPKLSNKEPWLAVNLSMLFPGIGQIYSGYLVRGLFFLISYLAALIFFILWLIVPQINTVWIFLLIPFIIFLQIWNLVDAYGCTRKANSPEFERIRKSDKDPWLAVFISQIIPGVGHFYIDKIFLGLFLITLWLISLFVPTLSALFLLLFPFILYHVYIAAPVHRETSKKIIIILAILLTVVPLVRPFIVKGYIAEARYIPSSSMEPTLQINDRLLIDKLSYHFQEPSRGDIVVFNPTDTLNKQGFKDAFISRIIGLPEETVALKNGKIYINDKPLAETYIKDGVKTEDANCGAYLSNAHSVTIPPNSYFVLGDNRGNSYDSRCWGVVPRENILGKATKIWFPPQRIGVIK